jgi:oxygen-dependent protoporphyrinogen oxidase
VSDRPPAGSGRVVIVGGGVSGLVAAHRLATRGLAAPGRRPHEVLVLEARDQLGGAVWTERRDGFTLEHGADSFLTSTPWAVDLCRELGLGDRLMATDPNYRRSFVVKGGRLLPVPEGFMLMAPRRLLPVLTSPILSWRGKLRLLMDLVRPRRTDGADESLAAFARRRLGREVLERLVQPLVGGIYTGDPNELSIRAVLPRFPQMEQRHGGLIRGAWREARHAGRDASGARYGLFATLEEGMDLLPRTLAAALPVGSIRLEAPVRRLLRIEPRGPWRVELLDGTALDASAVLLATEAHTAARLLDERDPELARQLRGIPYASSAIVQTAFPRDAVAHPLDGFGVVVPAIEGRSILAVSFTSVKFPSRAPAGTVLLRTFVGGMLQPELYDLDDEALVALVRRELEQLLGTRGEPLLWDVARHPRAMPQYTLGHLERIAAIRDRAARHPGLFLAGNAYDGVGLPDCIRVARATADRVFEHLSAAAKTAAA